MCVQLNTYTKLTITHWCRSWFTLGKVKSSAQFFMLSWGISSTKHKRNKIINQILGNLSIRVSFLSHTWIGSIMQLRTKEWRKKTLRLPLEGFVWPFPTFFSIGMPFFNTSVLTFFPFWVLEIEGARFRPQYQRKRTTTNCIHMPKTCRSTT